MTDLLKAAEHTPLPWEHVPSNQNHGAYVTTAFGTTVCDLYVMSEPSMPSLVNGGPSKPIPFTDADLNAALIVRAVNGYTELVSALDDIANGRLGVTDAMLESREAMASALVNYCQSRARTALSAL